MDFAPHYEDDHQSVVARARAVSTRGGARARHGSGGRRRAAGAVGARACVRARPRARRPAPARALRRAVAELPVAGAACSVEGRLDI